GRFCSSFTCCRLFVVSRSRHRLCRTEPTTHNAPTECAGSWIDCVAWRFQCVYDYDGRWANVLNDRVINFDFLYFFPDALLTTNYSSLAALCSARTILLLPPLFSCT